MKYFLISDNTDTLAGMRLAGVEGIVVHEPAEVRRAIEEVRQDDSVGLILITSKLFHENSSMIFDYKLHTRKPLIVEMPDRHGGDNVSDNIRRYIQEAVGIKI